MTKRMHLGILFIILVAVGCSSNGLDSQLQAVIQERSITPLDPGPAPDSAKVALGRVLFFDKELSGNRDIACASCHHPTEAGGDGLAVSIGTGGTGQGRLRQIGNGRSFIPRNAPEVFNRGATEWRTMFWDSRVFVDKNGRFRTPARDQLPDGLDSVLAAQAMFPVTSGDEMRGGSGDATDIYGQTNELAAIDENDLSAIWNGIMARLLAYPEYIALFQAAYPDVPLEELGFQHAANAIAAFEIDAFTLLGSPWDRYLGGEEDALSDAAKRGAMLFYGDVGCASCHSGPLFTDQQVHCLAVPQVGPGKGAEAPLDLGRMRETGNPAQRFSFRTPPLRNVAATGPWMHDGAFNSLETVVRHHINPATSLLEYDPAQHLPPELANMYQADPAFLVELAQSANISLPAATLHNDDIADLLAFLEALTDPAATDLEHITPATVPSGLPVTDEASVVQVR